MTDSDRGEREKNSKGSPSELQSFGAMYHAWMHAHSLNLVILERSNLRCHLQKSFPVGVILLSGPRLQ